MTSSIMFLPARRGAALAAFCAAALLFAAASRSQAQCQAPSITSQPRSVTNAPCSTNCATFSVSATGGGLVYQWFFNGSPIAGATFPSYTVCPVTPGAAGNYFVRVTNYCGMKTSSVARLVVQIDTTPPSITCPPDITRLNCSSNRLQIFFPLPPAIDDFDASPTVSCFPPSGSYFSAGTQTIRCSAVDDCGNSNSCTFRVTVVRDTTPPVLVCPPDVVRCVCGTSAAPIFYPAPTVTDDVDATPSVTCTPPTGSVFPIGQTTVSCIATDDCTNRSVCTFKVILTRDTTPPVLANCPTNRTLTACSSNGLIVTYTAPTATDNCSANVTVTCAPASGSVFSIGSTTVTCSATDDCTNRSTCTFTILIRRDTAPPVFANCPTNRFYWTCTNSAAVFFALPTATDDTDANVTVVCNPGSGTHFGPGIFTVTCTATDDCGHSNRCTFTVTVRRDTTPPVLNCPTNLLATSSNGLPRPVSFSVTALDDRDGLVPVTCQPPSGSLFPVGTTSVLCTAIDQCGKNNACGFLVRVRNGLPPTVTAVAPRALHPGGGTFVTVQGENFSADTVVRFAFPGPANALLNARVSADGRTITGHAPALPDSALFGSKAVIVEDTRGRAVLDVGVTYPSPNLPPSCLTCPPTDAETAVIKLFQDNVAGMFGFYVKQVNGPIVARHNETTIFEPASSIKVLILLQAMRRLQAGAVTLQTAIPWMADSTKFDGAGNYLPGGSDCPTDNNVSRSDTLDQALLWMMRRSDNALTAALRTYFGDANILTTAHDDAHMSANGTQLNHPIGCGPEMWVSHNRLTLADVGELHERVANGLLDSNTRSEFYAHMLSWSLNAIIDQEAPAAGLSAAEVAGFKAQIRSAVKGGSYGRNNVEWRSTAGWVRIPFPCESAPREYVFGGFIDSARSIADGFSVDNAVSELFRKVIREALPYVKDADGDGVPDLCDNCKNTPTSDQTDTDRDGKGDECDRDDDNDGVKDSKDQHPKNFLVPVGRIEGLCCHGNVMAFEGNDSDGDGLLDAEDLDDDNDGIPDESDPCPIGPLPGAFGDECSLLRYCCAPDKSLLRACLFGSCEEYFLKLKRVINPDPTLEVVFDHIQIVNEKIYITPLKGNSLAKTAKALAGQLPEQIQGFAPAGVDRLRLELWTRHGSNGVPAFYAIVAEFDSPSARLGAMDLGGVLVVSPPDTNGLPMSVEAAWTIGADPAALRADSDGDGLPDGWEIAHDLDWQDASDAARDDDGDGVSNAREFQTGTDPANAASRFLISRAQWEQGTMRIQFLSELGRHYRLLRSATPDHGHWSIVADGLAGNGGYVEVTDNPDAGQPTGFYRVELLNE